MELQKKIYSSWAFTENESGKASINREIYEEICKKYKISRCEVENPDDYDIVLRRTAGYNHSTYSVIKNTTNLSQLELALICDDENLCFGYKMEVHYSIFLKIKEEVEMSKTLEMARELVRLLEEAEKDNKVQLSELKPGEVFKIGKHDFIVLEQKNRATKVISKGFMAEDIVFDEDTRDYSKSNLKEVIESDIQPIIEAELGADNLVEHIVDLTSIDMQHEFKPCTCKVRPITFDEARQYNDLLVNKELNDWWWTCTPWSAADRGFRYSISVVSSCGCIRNCNCGYNCGVRSACILKSNIFVSRGE